MVQIASHTNYLIYFSTFRRVDLDVIAIMDGEGCAAKLWTLNVPQIHAKTGVHANQLRETIRANA